MVGVLEWALGLLETYVGPPSRHGHWSDEDRDGEIAIREGIAALADLDHVRQRAGEAPACDLPTFTAALGEVLSVTAGRVGRFGVGVYVGPVQTAASPPLPDPEVDPLIAELREARHLAATAATPGTSSGRTSRGSSRQWWRTWRRRGRPRTWSGCWRPPLL